jgi:hypothetical protein
MGKIGSWIEGLGRKLEGTNRFRPGSMPKEKIQSNVRSQMKCTLDSRAKVGGIGRKVCRAPEGKPLDIFEVFHLATAVGTRDVSTSQIIMRKSAYTQAKFQL